MGFQVKIEAEPAFNEFSVRYFHFDAQSQGSNVFEWEQICDSMSNISRICFLFACSGILLAQAQFLGSQLLLKALQRETKSVALQNFVGKDASYLIHL